MEARGDVIWADLGEPAGRRTACVLTPDPAIKRSDIQQAAAANPPKTFKLVLEKEAMSRVLDQLGSSEDMALAYVDNPAMQADVLAACLPFVHGRAKVMHQEHCPIVELLVRTRSRRTWSTRPRCAPRRLGPGLQTPGEGLARGHRRLHEHQGGGTLLIGVDDDGTIHCLDADYASRTAIDQDPRDWFQQHLANIVSATMGDAAATNVRPQIHHVDGHDLCRIQVDPSGFPVDAKVIYHKSNQPKEARTEFFVRVANATKVSTSCNERSTSPSDGAPG